jgi:phenylacetate-CoA ligase
MSQMLPLLRRNIFEKFNGIKCRSPKLSYWVELEKTQFLSEERLLEIQWHRLKELLYFAWEHNDFYRNRFQAAALTPDDIRSIEDMFRLPVLTKKEVQDNSLSLISRGFTIKNLQRAKTGGSTGKALELYFTEECSELRNACARRHDRWTGWEVGEPIAAVWGNPLVPASIKDKLKNWLLTPFIYLDTMNITEQSVQKFTSEWNRVKPTLLFGHAHSIYILAQYIHDMNITNIRPHGILSTSMMLIPHERKIIEQVFGTRVTDRYGCEEVSLIGSECEKHQGMHLNIEHLFIEFVKDDGTSARPGEPGRIVVTDLMNRAMPFIRYHVEDVGIPTDRKCTCGRGLPLMEHITGRVADFLVKRDGSRVAGVSLIENTLTKIPGISQMQIIQESLQRIVLNVVPGDEFDAEKDRSLVDYFKNLFGEGVNIDRVMMKEIKPETSGKYRFSICKVDPSNIESTKHEELN